MKHTIIYLLFALLSTQLAFSQNQDAEKAEAFQLTINNKVKVDVTHTSCYTEKRLEGFSVNPK